MALNIVYQGKTVTDLDVIIRYPVRTDLGQLHLFINRLSKEQTYIRFQGEEISLKDEKMYLNSLLNKIKTKKAISLLAFHQNELIGSTDIVMQEKVENHIGIFGIVVARLFRNRGVGRILMEKILNEAEKNLQDLKTITLGVFSSNNIARSMYKKFGFKEFGKLPRGLKYRGKLEDHFYMYRNK
jgi:ribosomal protein S18 acetylase RimI-like enzyme